MTFAEIVEACSASLEGAREFGWPEADAKVTLVTPKGWRPPLGFPRGYLLQVKDNGDRLSSYPAPRLLAWIRKAGAA